MSLIHDIWGSFRRLPHWVQIWVALILVPVNLAWLAFLGYPGAGLVAALAVGALAVNSMVLLAERGLSKAMVLPHLALWTPLLAVIFGLLARNPGFAPLVRHYLWLLFAVDAVSLAFDLADALKWKRGDRAVA